MHIFNEFSYTYITTVNSSSGLVTLSSPPTGYVLCQGVLASGSIVDVSYIRHGVYSFKYLVNFPVNSTIGLLIEYIDPTNNNKIAVIKDSGKVLVNENLVLRVIASTGV